MKIGIFDSGVGGLSVLREINSNTHGHDIIYFADTLRVPYGDKTKEEIIKYSIEICDFLLSKNVSMIIVACNTASANALDILKNRYSIPIIGMLDSAMMELKKIDFKSVLVLATKATVNSHKYKEEINKNFNINDILEISAPKLVPMIENNKMEEIDSILDEYIGNIKKDVVVLGCTHYPFIKEKLKKYDMKIVDPSKSISSNLTSVGETNNKVRYYVTGDKDKFILNVYNLLNEKIEIEKD